MSTKKWAKKVFEKYRISYVLIVDFADPEIILAGECTYSIRWFVCLITWWVLTVSEVGSCDYYAITNS